MLLFDFDGTLAPLVNDPAQARPADGILDTLRQLAERNDLVVISGRDRAFLEKTFAGVPICLVAEHGAFLKKADQDWERLDLTTDDWVMPVRTLIEPLVARYPGSFIEQKETAIAWHYRNAEADDIEGQAVELAAQLRGAESAVALAVIQGSKVVEVKPAQHSKGTVALRILEQRPYDFIVSIGDDTTDEDMFRQMPNWAYTVKVGAGQSYARYRVARQRDVDTLLEQLNESMVEA